MCVFPNKDTYSLSKHKDYLTAKQTDYTTEKLEQKLEFKDMVLNKLQIPRSVREDQSVGQ